MSTYMYRPDPGTVMAQQINRGHRKQVGVDQMLAADELSRTLITRAGYFEYMLGYFAKAPEHRCKGEEYYFSLQGDYVGFGSGAGSILGHHSLSNAPAHLHRFIANPTAFDSVAKSSPHHAFGDALRQALLTSSGVDFRRFKRLYGFDFAEVRDRASMVEALEFFRRCGAAFDETDERLALTDATRHRAYVKSYAQSSFYGPSIDSGQRKGVSLAVVGAE